jgi:hypothetical protein
MSKLGRTSQELMRQEIVREWRRRRESLPSGRLATAAAPFVSTSLSRASSGPKRRSSSVLAAIEER